VKLPETNIREFAALSRLMQLFPGPAKRPLQRLRRQVERLRPYPALLLLAGPLAVVEPLKLATVFIAGEGHWVTSVLVMLFAYAVSLFITHWLFVVVKPKLLTLRWFAWVWNKFVTWRTRAWRWIGRREARRHTG
jgi:hypothetical protein